MLIEDYKWPSDGFREQDWKKDGPEILSKMWEVVFERDPYIPHG